MSATDNLLANISKVRLATPYVLDKIVGVLTGSFNAGTDTTTPASGFRLFKIAHSFTRPVFCELLFSTDGGTTYTEGGLGKAIAYSDSSYVYILTIQTSGTCNYKVICTWIDNYDATNPSITPQLNTTSLAYFDSRQNYPKIYLQNVVTATTKAADTTFTITHSLGYVPNFKIYFESFSGQVWPQIYGGSNDPWLYDFSHQAEAFGVANSTQLKLDCFIPTSGSSTRVWYKVYLDS